MFNTTQYCNELNIGNTAKHFIKILKNEFDYIANKVDKEFLENDQLSIDQNGIPKLKKIKRGRIDEKSVKIIQDIYEKIPERNLLDILCNVEHWVKYTRHFGLLSGSDSKLKEQTRSYILSCFTYGCNLGPIQTAIHLKQNISGHSLSYINRKHITAYKLDMAKNEIINIFNKFKLPSYWGTGKHAAADGTKIDIYDQNLFSEYHIRYGGSGGIAYHHVSDKYVVIFSHFIPCSIWEAVYIIDGLLKNESDINPKYLHGDTQNQSTPVFGLSYFLGIELMPRIRNWKDLILFRPNPKSKYKHIDKLFSGAVNWDLIEKHWKDMIQVILSIYQGKISSSIILRKLGNYSRKNKLYKAFRELGRIRRTIFLLKKISNLYLRKIIHSTTNKAESYNAFSQILRFGNSGIIQTNDPIEQEKRIKYSDLIANAVMLHNVVDITEIIKKMNEEGIIINDKVKAKMSPYMTYSINKFGEYSIDLAKIPPPLEYNYDV